VISAGLLLAVQSVSDGLVVTFSFNVHFAQLCTSSSKHVVVLPYSTWYLGCYATSGHCCCCCCFVRFIDDNNFSISAHLTYIRVVWHFEWYADDTLLYNGSFIAHCLVRVQLFKVCRW